MERYLRNFISELPGGQALQTVKLEGNSGCRIHGEPCRRASWIFTLQLSSHALRRLCLSSVSAPFFSASLLTQPSKFLYSLIQIVDGFD